MPTDKAPNNALVLDYFTGDVTWKTPAQVSSSSSHLEAQTPTDWLISGDYCNNTWLLLFPGIFYSAQPSFFLISCRECVCVIRPLSLVVVVFSLTGWSTTHSFVSLYIFCPSISFAPIPCWIMPNESESISTRFCTSVGAFFAGWFCLPDDDGPYVPDTHTLTMFIMLRIIRRDTTGMHIGSEAKKQQYRRISHGKNICFHFKYLYIYYIYLNINTSFWRPDSYLPVVNPSVLRLLSLVCVFSLTRPIHSFISVNVTFIHLSPRFLFLPNS